MPSTFLGLNTAYTGLLRFQAGSNTVAHNISNSNTEGYTRQEVNVSATTAIRTNQSYGMMGTGVGIDSIEQQRNNYYDTKYRLNVAKNVEYSIENDYQLNIQTYLDEIASESGYTKMLTQIQNAMQDLSVNPGGDTERTQYLNSLKSFTDLINEVSVNLQQSQTDANDEISICVTRINSISQQIYKLGQEITVLEVDGNRANDLRDKRNLLIDELSELVNTDVREVPITYGGGANRKESYATTLEVRINGELLVDSMGYRQLSVIPRARTANENDISGIVDVYWDDASGGTEFNMNSPTLRGKLRGLYEMRDGNYMDNLQGKISEVTSTDVKVELDEPIRMEDLSISADGQIYLNYKAYYYDSFEADYATNAKGETVITAVKFKDLKYRVTADDVLADTTGTLTQGELAKKDMTAINPPLDGKTATQGKSIDGKGIPYYMQQLNQFVRTISKYMNEIHTSGADSDENPGLDLFTTVDPQGDDLILTGSVGDSGTFSSGDHSYWSLTSLNWDINTEIMSDNKKVVVSTLEDVRQNNVDAKPILDKIMAGFEDTRMFKQGTPFQFMTTVSSDIAVDALKTDMFMNNLTMVVNSIDTQRQSISSVDTNEEASNLMIFRQGYNLSSKVLSVLNEMLNKLINETGV